MPTSISQYKESTIFNEFEHISNLFLSIVATAFFIFVCKLKCSLEAFRLQYSSNISIKIVTGCQIR